MIRHVALIAYDFPPLNSGGALRPLNMAKAIKDSNINVTVFTLSEKSYPESKCSFSGYESLLDGIDIVRVNLRKPRMMDWALKGNYFHLTDPIGRRWLPNLLKALHETHHSIPIDLLLATCPPFSLAPMVRRLSQMINIPYSIDLRDAWSTWVTSPYATRFHYAALVKLEKSCLLGANFVICTSQQQKKDILNAHHELDERKLLYAPNGFSCFHEVQEKPKNSDTIRILYTGAFYYNPKSDRLINSPWFLKYPYQWLQFVPRKEQWKYRSPFYFFKFLSRLKELNAQLYNRIEVVFAGEKPKWFNHMLQTAGVEEKVIHKGFLSRQEMRSLITSADWLLLTSAKVPHGRDYSIAGKTFEYISYQKPILSFVCEGEQKDLLSRLGNAKIIDPDSLENLQKSSFSFLDRIHELPLFNMEEASKYLIPNNFSLLLEALKK